MNSENERSIEYAVRFESILNYLRRKTLHQIALKSFDVLTARILELLLKTKYLEQGKISEMIIMPAQDAKKRVYQLFR